MNVQPVKTQNISQQLPEDKEYQECTKHARETIQALEQAIKNDCKEAIYVKHSDKVPKLVMVLYKVKAQVCNGQER
ncbi:unnamed protein product [Ambrosiozyma monospora]|uniref:Unnamed protein product n=1 Tax=Ambrosiozyma monospora TaxID=43982 RepID=A0ACB5UAI7_AMBMO|nr:unnamed protein product [Ambrosiozyma monospora]